MGLWFARLQQRHAGGRLRHRWQSDPRRQRQHQRRGGREQCWRRRRFGDVGSRLDSAGNGSGAASSGSTSSGGTSSGGSSSGGNGPAADCSDPGLTWKSANKTWYESYPDPGSEECIKYNGCTWAGQFSACEGKKSEAWVSAHDIVSAFPDFDTLELHDLCLRSGDKTLVVTVLDTCGDADCDGCCTQNQGSADELIDIESYTNARWGVEDGPIEWADLGPTRGDGCN